MAIIDINSIIYPITNEIRSQVNNAITSIQNRIESVKWQIQNSVANAISPIVNTIRNIGEGITFAVSNAVRSVKDEITNKINSIFMGIQSTVADAKRTIESVKDSLSNTVNNVKNFIVSEVHNIAGTIRNKIDSVVHSVKTEISSVVNTIKRELLDVISDIKATGATIISSIKNEITNTYNRITTYVSNKIEDVRHSIENTVNNVKNSVSNFIENAKNSINGFIESVKTRVEDTKNYLSSKLSEFKDKVIHNAELAYDRIRNFIQGQIDIIKTKAENAYKDIKDFINGKIEAIREMVDKTIDDLKAWIDSSFQYANELREGAVKDAIDSIGKQFDSLMFIFDKVTNNEYQSYSEFKRDFEKIGGQGGLLTALFGTVTALGAMANIAIGVGQPYAQNIVNLSMADAQPSIIPVPTLIDLFYKRRLDNDFMYSEAGKQGFSKERFSKMIESSEGTPSPGDIQIAFLRGEINESKHDEYLRAFHYTQETIDLFKQLYVVIPPVQDIITMAVKEAFSPETAERFGQYEDFPEEFATFAAKQGLSRDWARRYWAAHWSLPSPTMGFEMLHRGIIEQNDLVLLLKALDIMPFWREKLIQLSYSPYTRVDIRRMHAVGVLSEEGVFTAYKDIGYNDERAKKLTEFTIKLNTKTETESEKEIRLVTKGVIQQAYTRGLIDRNEAMDRLLKLGGSPDEVSFTITIWDNIKELDSTPDRRNEIAERTIKTLLSAYAKRTFGREETIIALERIGLTNLEASLELDYIDYEYETKLKTLFMENAREQYINWSINETTFKVALNDAGFNSSEIDTMIKEFNILRDQRLRKPTMADIKRWVNNGLITIQDYAIELAGQGYSDYYIKLYLQEVSQ